MPFSTYLGNKLLDHVLKNTAYTPPVTVYCSLHTADPGLTGANEVAGGTYGRQAATFAAGAAKATDNLGALSFTLMPACTVTHVGLWDNSAGGNFLIGAQATASKAVNAGDTYQIAIGNLDVTLT